MRIVARPYPPPHTHKKKPDILFPERGGLSPAAVGGNTHVASGGGRVGFVGHTKVDADGAAVELAPVHLLHRLRKSKGKLIMAATTPSQRHGKTKQRGDIANGSIKDKTDERLTASAPSRVAK